MNKYLILCCDSKGQHKRFKVNAVEDNAAIRFLEKQGFTECEILSVSPNSTVEVVSKTSSDSPTPNSHAGLIAKKSGNGGSAAGNKRSNRHSSRKKSQNESNDHDIEQSNGNVIPELMLRLLKSFLRGAGKCFRYIVIPSAKAVWRGIKWTGNFVILGATKGCSWACGHLHNCINRLMQLKVKTVDNTVAPHRKSQSSSYQTKNEQLTTKPVDHITIDENTRETIDDRNVARSSASLDQSNRTIPEVASPGVEITTDGEPGNSLNDMPEDIIDDTSFHVLTKKGLRGPFPFSKLVQLVAAGKLLPQHRVRGSKSSEEITMAALQKRVEAEENALHRAGPTPSLRLDGDNSISNRIDSHSPVPAVDRPLWKLQTVIIIVFALVLLIVGGIAVYCYGIRVDPQTKQCIASLTEIRNSYLPLADSALKAENLSMGKLDEANNAMHSAIVELEAMKKAYANSQWGRITEVEKECTTRISNNMQLMRGLAGLSDITNDLLVLADSALRNQKLEEAEQAINAAIVELDAIRKLECYQLKPQIESIEKEVANRKAGSVVVGRDLRVQSNMDEVLDMFAHLTNPDADLDKLATSAKAFLNNPVDWPNGSHNESYLQQYAAEVERISAKMYAIDDERVRRKANGGH